MIWGLFKKRKPGDIDRLVSGYRYLLKISNQDQGNPGSPWIGGFAQTFQFFNKSWPSPNEIKGFEKKMLLWSRKIKDMEEAYIHAFNDYLGQKKLTREELSRVFSEGKKAFFK